MASQPASLPSTAARARFAHRGAAASSCGSAAMRRCRGSASGAPCRARSSRPSTRPLTPWPEMASKVSAAEQAEAHAPRRRDDGLGQGMLARLLEAGGEAKERRLVEASERRDVGDRRACLRSACRSCRRRAVSTVASRSSASAFFISTPSRRHARRNHDRDGRGKPERARAGDDEHGDGGHNGIGERRARAQAIQAKNARTAISDDGRHEIAGHRDRPDAGSARGCAAPPPPTRRCAPAWCRRRPCGPP